MLMGNSNQMFTHINFFDNVNPTLVDKEVASIAIYS